MPTPLSATSNSATGSRQRMVSDADPDGVYFIALEMMAPTERRSLQALHAQMRDIAACGDLASPPNR